MATVPPAKRQGTNTLPAADSSASPTSSTATTLSVEGYLDCISSLPSSTVDSLLAAAASAHPSVAASIVQAVEDERTAAAAKVIDFDRYSETAWRALNITYARLSSSQQYEAAGECCHTVIDCISSIEEQTPAHASFASKKSALETLRKIGKSITFCRGNALGHEVHIWFQQATSLEDTMLRILQSLSGEEKERLRDGGDFVGKLEELERLGARWLCLRSCIWRGRSCWRRVLRMMRRRQIMMERTMGINWNVLGGKGEDEDEMEEEVYYQLICQADDLSS